MEKETFKKMVTEFQELSDKVTKCRTFILDKDKFEKLDMINRDLLITQLKAMETYLSVLSIRLGINSSSQDKEAVEPISEPVKLDD